MCETANPAGGEGAPNPIDVYVGRALGRLRRQAGTSVERLAAAVGVSPRRVQAWEAGTERVRAAELYDVTRALGVPVSAVFAGLIASQVAANDDHRP